jgi:hypothetical protein
MKTARRVIKVSLLVDEDVYEKVSAYAQLTGVSVFEAIRVGLLDWTGSMLAEMPRGNVTDGQLPPGSE